MYYRGRHDQFPLVFTSQQLNYTELVLKEIRKQNTPVALWVRVSLLSTLNTRILCNVPMIM